MDNFVIISGCSGGGKSTLLEASAERGYATVKEPGRRIIMEERASGGSAIPWSNPEAFARRAIRLSLQDRASLLDRAGWVFFDRGLIDALSALQAITAKLVLNRLARRHRYQKIMFITPPWPEIYVRDNERRHDLVDAMDEYHRLCRIYPALGYDSRILPKVSVAERADLVLSDLASVEAFSSTNVSPLTLRTGEGQ